LYLAKDCFVVVDDDDDVVSASAMATTSSFAHMSKHNSSHAVLAPYILPNEPKALVIPPSPTVAHSMHPS